MNKMFSNKKVILTLIAPSLFFFLAVVLAPILLSIYYSMTNFTGLNAAEFIGLDNYRRMFQDPVFWRSLKNSLILAVGLICIQHPLALLISVVLDRIGGKMEAILRGIYFIPDVIAVTVIVSLWKYIYNPNYGLLLKIMKIFGYTGSFNALDIKHALWAIIALLIWYGFGSKMLIYYSGVKGVDPQLYEAAALDGAGGFQAFLYVTLPQLWPIVTYQVTMTFIGALKTMDVVLLLTNGGPLDSTQFLCTYLYDRGFANQQFSYGCTVGVACITICLAGTLLIQGLNRKSAED